MKTIKLTLGIALISALFAFTTFTSSNQKLIGNYGEKNTFQIVLNEDNTFTYFEQSNRKNVETTGKWEIVNEELFLKSDNNSKIKTKWRLANGGSCLRTKKGFTIYTLCRKCTTNESL